MDILVVIDMQNDFIDGALGTPEAEAIVPNVVDRVKDFNGLVPVSYTHLFRMDAGGNCAGNSTCGKVFLRIFLQFWSSAGFAMAWIT